MSPSTLSITFSCEHQAILLQRLGLTLPASLGESQAARLAVPSHIASDRDNASDRVDCRNEDLTGRRPARLRQEISDPQPGTEAPAQSQRVCPSPTGQAADLQPLIFWCLGKLTGGRKKRNPQGLAEASFHNVKACSVQALPKVFSHRAAIIGERQCLYRR